MNLGRAHSSLGPPRPGSVCSTRTADAGKRRNARCPGSLGNPGLDLGPHGAALSPVQMPVNVPVWPALDWTCPLPCGGTQRELPVASGANLNRPAERGPLFLCPPVWDVASAAPGPRDSSWASPDHVERPPSALTHSTLALFLLSTFTLGYAPWVISKGGRWTSCSGKGHRQRHWSGRCWGNGGG